MVQLCRRQTDVIFKKLASSSSGFNSVSYRLAHLPYTEVEELGDGEGTDNHLGGNVPLGEGGARTGEGVQLCRRRLARVTVEGHAEGLNSEPK